MKTNEINIRDPFVLFENGKYYLYVLGESAQYKIVYEYNY